MSDERDLLQRSSTHEKRSSAVIEDRHVPPRDLEFVARNGDRAALYRALAGPTGAEKGESRGARSRNLQRGLGAGLAGARDAHLRHAQGRSRAEKPDSERAMNCIHGHLLPVVAAV